ncbi:hypothetical protein A3860_12445 [Niastella vici]|uniref:HTH araC/xylS-type domain-containing protein n=1 Tax=Niastella vici TaxID=1703345 RepID=A0A1V9G764_9BACT|nr:AraC family transcriptional regulator [Niastella vici]OQP66306.1 hypothetical protein A3860_12445 [Niastella vici]
MKPVFAKIFENSDAAVFAVKVIELPYFSTEFHFHQECQLVYVVESEGKRIVGDSIESFQSDELILLGSDIPHVWHNDKHYFELDRSQVHARSIALFFNPDKLVDVLACFHPGNKLGVVLARAKRGMKFYGAARNLIKGLLFEMIEKTGMPQLTVFFRLLEVLCETKEYELLAGDGYINTYKEKDNDRIDKVFKYVFTNFNKDIQLEAVSALVCMNKQAFCRFFKSRTQKTFIEFVNSIRIGHACKLITEGETQIANLAYDCGFNSLSNFNRLFKEIKGVTPSEYRKMIEAGSPLAG